jgi:hypothetical protein
MAGLATRRACAKCSDVQIADAWNWLQKKPER